MASGSRDNVPTGGLSCREWGSFQNRRRRGLTKLGMFLRVNGKRKLKTIFKIYLTTHTIKLHQIHTCTHIYIWIDRNKDTLCPTPGYRKSFICTGELIYVEPFRAQGNMIWKLSFNYHSALGLQIAWWYFVILKKPFTYTCKNNYMFSMFKWTRVYIYIIMCTRTHNPRNTNRHICTPYMHNHERGKNKEQLLKVNTV